MNYDHRRGDTVIFTRQLLHAVRDVAHAGKAFSYFASQESWIKEVWYHPVSDDSSVCLLKSSCTPSQRISQIPHKLWVCLHKKTGAVERAYCTCSAGLVYFTQLHDIQYSDDTRRHDINYNTAFLTAPWSLKTQRCSKHSGNRYAVDRVVNRVVKLLLCSRRRSRRGTESLRLRCHICLWVWNEERVPPNHPTMKFQREL